MRSHRRKLELAAVPALVALTVVAVGALVDSTRVTAANASAPNSIAPPTVSGTAQQGQKLVGHRGRWAGTRPISYTDYWQRCDKDGGSCANISGAHDRDGYVLKGVTWAIHCASGCRRRTLMVPRRDHLSPPPSSQQQP